MAELARRGPVADSIYLQFAVRGDRLLAVGSGSGEGIATELQIPSLKLLGSSGFPVDSNYSIQVSQGNTFVFDESVSIASENPPVVIYPDSAGLFPRSSRRG